MRVAKVEEVRRVRRGLTDGPGEVHGGRVRALGRAPTKLDDPQRVGDGGGRLGLVQRVELVHGAVESFESDERLRDRESRAAEERRRGRNGVRGLERAIVQVLRRVHVPELQLDARIHRSDSHGAFEKSLLDGRRPRHEPLDVELEGFERKMGRGARGPRAETPRHVRDAAGHAVEQREDLRQRGRVLDRRPFCSRTEANEPARGRAACRRAPLRRTRDRTPRSARPP